MTRPVWTSLALVLLAACGDAADPGGETGTTTPDPTADDTTSTQPPTTGEPDDTGGTQGTPTAEATTDDTTPPAECSDASQCPSPPGPCQEATCEAGACGLRDLEENTPLPDDPDDCVSPVCDGAGGSKNIPADDPPNDNPDDCVAPVCEDGALKWVPADDPPADTAGDCKKTACDAGEVVFVADDLDLPDDTVECTQDTCAAGEPEFVPKPTNTFCGPGGSMFCHDDAECRACKQVDETCEDESNTEANDTQATAHDIGNISDNDSTGGFLCPVLDGPGDVDWYTFTGDDVFPYVVDPTRVVTAGMNARLCVYFQCLSGTTSVTCNADEDPDMAPGGQKGCCGTGNVSPGLNCSGLDDAAEVWMKVENVDMLECVGYQLDYHF